MMKISPIIFIQSINKTIKYSLLEDTLFSAFYIHLKMTVD